MKKLKNKDLVKIREGNKMMLVASNFDRIMNNKYEKKDVDFHISRKGFSINNYFGLSLGNYYLLNNNIIKYVHYFDSKKILMFWRIA